MEGLKLIGAFALFVVVFSVGSAIIIWTFQRIRGVSGVIDNGENDSVEDSTSTVTPAPTRSTHAARQTDYEPFSSLPTIYYVLAIFCGVVLLIVTLVNAGDLSGAEIGGLIGYTVGSVLSMLAVGRVIELLQQIRDAVRNTPALSPGRPDDE